MQMTGQDYLANQPATITPTTVTASPLQREAFCSLPRYREALYALNAACDEAAKPLMLVTGPQGIGKTTLLNTLAARRSETCVTIVASQGTTVQNLVKAWVTACQQTMPVAVNGQLLTVLAAENQQSIVLLIDNAHELPTATLRELIGLAKSEYAGSLSIILFGALVLQQQCRQLVGKEGVTLNQVSLTQLSLAESKQYLLARVQQEPSAAGIDLDDIPDMLLNHLHASAKGLPAALNRTVIESILPWITEHRVPATVSTSARATATDGENDLYVTVTHWMSWFLLTALVVVMTIQPANRIWLTQLSGKVYAAVPAIHLQLG